jgi:hypothetical protein
MQDETEVAQPPSADTITQVNESLLRFSAVFPLELFPDEVILDRLKISIIKRDFIISKRTITIPLTATVSVKTFRGPLTSQIEVQDTRTFKQGPIKVRNMMNSDASRFRQIVEGIVIGMRQGINFMEMSKEEMLATTIKWGSVDV